MAPRLVTISTRARILTVAFGHRSWTATVTVNGMPVYEGEPRASFSKALREARDYAAAIKLEVLR